MIPSRFVVGLLCLLLLWAVPADAQHRCGGHTIHWIGGAPRASLDRGPRDHEPPTIPEPAGMSARDRELWDAIVYDAYDHPMPNPMSENGMTSLPLEDRRTLVIAENTVPTIQICIQSSDESYTGERLAAYSDTSWWRRQIDRWTNFSWRGDIQIDACTDEPMTGWIHVREGKEGEVSEEALAHASSWRYYDPHRILSRWSRSEIVWHPGNVRDLDEDHFEEVLAHELGHALGLWHAPSGSGFVMMGSGWASRPWPDKERWLSQWANHVGPNVQYPGLVRADDTPGDPPDRTALMALYHATDGKNWKNSRNWGTAAPLDDWYGVTIDGAGRVTRLGLTGNNLTGSIPPELGDLANLEKLWLRSNNLTGSIPPELGDLANLEDMDLPANNLTGPIPPELGDLANLEALWLYENNLTGPIPPELGDLANLEFLNLHTNNLTGPVPPELGLLANLVFLVLHINNLTGPIPPELGDLANLEELWLRSNNLTGPLPSSMTNLRRLDRLNIYDNAGLCAPADDAFQAWLASVNFKGDTCAAEDILSAGVKDLTEQALADLQEDSDERRTAEAVPALPVAGVVLLAMLLGLLGGRGRRVA